MRVAVIGGGPSGLVTLKCLTQANHYFAGHEPVEAVLFESAPGIGGVYLHHMYEGGEMVSSKFLTPFSDYRPRPDDPDFLPCGRYLEYLKGYCDHFNLWPHMKLSTAVTSTRRGDPAAGERGHVLEYRTQDGVVVEWQCDAIAMCTGLHSEPNVPAIPGIESVPVVMHSADFKDRTQFGQGKTVMVLGTGETAFDITHLAVTTPATKKVVLCHRGGFLGAPKRLMKAVLFPGLRGINVEGGDCFEGRLPVDAAITALFDTMYVHKAMRDSMRVWDFYNEAVIGSSWLFTGTENAFENWVGYLPPEKRHVSQIIFNKAWEKLYPHVVGPYRPKILSRAERIRRFFIRVPEPIVDRYVDMAPFPTHFDADGVAHFADNGREEYQRIKDQKVRPDVVILATGYTQSFPILQSPANAGRRPYPTPADVDVRNLWRRDDPTVAFVGHVRPSFGAIPPLSELQAMLWIMNLLGRVRRPLLPEDEWHYRVLHPADSRLRYGVEHESYAYQLAKDMDSAPGVLQVLATALTSGHPRAWYRVPVVWATGSSFVVKFRLAGPWRYEGAAAVMTDELWETITRRTGIVGYFFLIVHPIIAMGLWSLFYFLFYTAWAVLSRLRLSGPPRYVNEAEVRWRRNQALREKMEMESKAGGKRYAVITNGEHGTFVNGTLNGMNGKLNGKLNGNGNGILYA